MILKRRLDTLAMVAQRFKWTLTLSSVLTTTTSIIDKWKYLPLLRNICFFFSFLHDDTWGITKQRAKRLLRLDKHRRWHCPSFEAFKTLLIQWNWSRFGVYCKSQQKLPILVCRAQCIYRRYQERPNMKKLTHKVGPCCSSTFEVKAISASNFTLFQERFGDSFLQFSFSDNGMSILLKFFNDIHVSIVERWLKW